MKPESLPLLKKTLVALCFCMACGHSYPFEWKGNWISASDCDDLPNTWLDFQKKFELEKVPEHAVAHIAADSKYWLSVNGEMVVFEGSLKRGPNPNDTYYDSVDITRWLTPGVNDISVSVCYFGRDGFSHKSSGRAGLLFDCRMDNGDEIVSDATWTSSVNPCFMDCGDPVPNYRLSEASILFDARNKVKNRNAGKKNAVVIGKAGDAPWNGLVERPVPLWRFSGPTPYVETIHKGDSIIGVLPYNAQITPIIRLRSEGGKRVVIGTDNYFHYNGSVDNIRAEYITAEGEQEYEAPGWMNGHRVYYVIPDGVEVLDIEYRESGFDCDFVGGFESSDDLLDRLWDKSRRTLYVTMRDTYMDCPERERAQWTGDAVNESGEAFYALSPSGHSLAKKWLLELADWQRPDSVIYAPVPAGNWNMELPGQTLASIGWFGAWNYYNHTGDKATLERIYPAFKRYMARWETNDSGLVKMPEGAWIWGDWGDHKDMDLLISAWYYLALKGMSRMASELGLTDDSREYERRMDAMQTAFDACWTPDGYRSKGYKGETDDRVQALAVVAGIAGSDMYPVIMDVFSRELHASPYMEKYVFEAMMLMGETDKALDRHKERYRRMTEDDRFTTLFEHWDVADNNFKGGTVNHAWSGGGLTVLSQYLCGIEPLSPGYEEIGVMPRPGSMKYASANIESVKGEVRSAFMQDDKALKMDVSTPEGIPTVIGVPVGDGIKRVSINGAKVWEAGKKVSSPGISQVADSPASHLLFRVPGGNYNVVAFKEK